MQLYTLSASGLKRKPFAYSLSTIWKLDRADEDINNKKQQIEHYAIVYCLEAKEYFNMNKDEDLQYKRNINLVMKHGE